MSSSALSLPVASPDPLINDLNVYIVGGAVRDSLLGLLPGDRDWVVVGASPEIMAEKGFIPVGGDFPVFLHPVTKEEFALARTERKSGRGYRGFTFYTGQDVSLEEDLRRRDLTINAIAQTPEGCLVDPLNGLADIQQHVLRHVGEAFCEDPVRLLRLARFSARFTYFSISPGTLALARNLVTQGEVDALVPERVWREVSKGLISEAPQRMFQVLAQVGALERVMPGLAFTEYVQQCLYCATQHGLPLASRAALLCLDSADSGRVMRAVKAPSQCVEYARLLPIMQSKLWQAQTPSGWYELIERCDGLRKPERFLDLVQAACCGKDQPWAMTQYVQQWRNRLSLVQGVEGGVIARQYAGDPAGIKQAIKQARIKALSV